MAGLDISSNELLRELADEHREWLSKFDSQYKGNWEKLLNNNNESGMAEASVRRRLQRYGVDVQPNEDLDTGKQAPDFRCKRLGIEFFVEVTCIQIETMVKKTGIPDSASSCDHPVNPSVLPIFYKCVNKARQSSAADGPVLVAIGTWRGFAARMLWCEKFLVNMLLTGDTKLTWDINIETGEESDTYLTTNLYPAIFLKPDEDKNPTAARESISGVLLCAFGMEEIPPLVVLHPNANWPFDPTVLPKLEYGTVEVDHERRQLNVNWSRGEG